MFISKIDVDEVRSLPFGKSQRGVVENPLYLEADAVEQNMISDDSHQAKDVTTTGSFRYSHMDEVPSDPGYGQIQLAPSKANQEGKDDNDEDDDDLKSAEGKFKYSKFK